MPISLPIQMSEANVAKLVAGLTPRRFPLLTHDGNSVVDYGWPAAVKAPELTEWQREFLDELEVEVEFGHNYDTIGNSKCYAAHLQFTDLLPTQAHIDPASLARLDEAEDLPHIIVLLSNGKYYIHDGHHRATRAMLRGELIDAVVVNLEMIK